MNCSQCDHPWSVRTKSGLLCWAHYRDLLERDGRSVPQYVGADSDRSVSPVLRSEYIRR